MEVICIATGGPNTEILLQDNGRFHSTPIGIPLYPGRGHSGTLSDAVIFYYLVLILSTKLRWKSYSLLVR
jgi:hypothetical protein